MLRQYTKPTYIFGAIAIAWLLSLGLLLLLSDHAGLFDLLKRSIVVTALLLAIGPLLFLVLILGRLVGILPFLGFVVLGNMLHRNNSRYALLFMTRPVDLSRLTLSSILFAHRLPLDVEKT